MSAAAPAVNDRRVFFGLLALLCWAPLPLGSNRTWAVALLVIWSQLLLYACAWQWRGAGDVALARLRSFRWPLALLAAFVLLAWGQLLPLPPEVLALLSPETLAVETGVAPLRLTLDIHQSAIYAALSFAFLSVFIVALLTVRDAERLETLARGLVYSGLFQVAVGTLLYSAEAHYRIFFSEVLHDRMRGTFVYQNHMAGYMELCLSVGIGLMLARLGGPGRPAPNWKHRIVRAIEFLLSPKMRLRLMLVALVIGLVLTRSRMGNTGIFSAMLLVGMLTVALSRKTAPATVGLIVSLMVIDVVIVGSWIGLEKLTQRLQETALVQEVGLRDESIELRLDAARYAWDLVRDFPAFGTGGGSFYNTYLRYRTPRQGYFDHAHNDYVEFAADYGMVGCVFLGGLVVLTLARGIGVLYRRRSSLPRGIAFGGLMALVTLIIHSTVDFNLQSPANALTTVVVIAMIWIAAELPSGRSQRAGLR